MTAYPIDVSVAKEPGRFVASVRGDLDVGTADAVWDAIGPASLEGAHVVLDLSGVTFLDSVGLSVLLRAARSADESGGALTLRRPSHAVSQLIDIAMLDGYFAIERGT